MINTDKNPAYGEAIAELKKEGAIPKELEHRQVKYLNNRLECDHGKLKRLIRPTLGFQSMRTARATIKGFEVMRMFKKGQFKLLDRCVWAAGARLASLTVCSAFMPEPPTRPRHHTPTANLCNGAHFLAPAKSALKAVPLTIVASSTLQQSTHGRRRHAGTCARGRP